MLRPHVLRVRTTTPRNSRHFDIIEGKRSRGSDCFVAKTVFTGTCIGQTISAVVFPRWLRDRPCAKYSVSDTSQLMFSTLFGVRRVSGAPFAPLALQQAAEQGHLLPLMAPVPEIRKALA